MYGQVLVASELCSFKSRGHAANTPGFADASRVGRHVAGDVVFIRRVCDAQAVTVVGGVAVLWVVMETAGTLASATTGKRKEEDMGSRLLRKMSKLRQSYIMYKWY